MTVTGTLWFVLPIILIGGAFFLIDRVFLRIVCFGLSMVLLSVPVLLAGWSLRRHKFLWLVYPGALIAIIGGVIPIISFSMSMSFNAVMNDVTRFSPARLESWWAVGGIVAVGVFGPLSILIGVCGVVAAIRAQLAGRGS